MQKPEGENTDLSPTALRSPLVRGGLNYCRILAPLMRVVE